MVEISTGTYIASVVVLVAIATACIVDLDGRVNGQRENAVIGQQPLSFNNSRNENL